jgi:uncharacterized lipoprotein YehR (DUF1307 family)
MKKLLITKVIILMVVLLIITLTSCGVTQETLTNIRYTKEITTDSTITYVYYDSTIVRIVKNKLYENK